MAETVSIRLALTGAQDVARGIKQVGDAGDREFGRIDVAAGGLGKTIGSLASTVVPVLAAAFSADKFIEINREISKLQGSLVGITGSMQGAGQAMSYLEGLTSGTTLTLQGVTEAFIKLKTLGLDASQRSLVAYGNISAAMGKDIMQFIEAVADATTGEFERLKEFGITAKKVGNDVSLGFQGVNTTVANSAQAVGKYLRDLGENKFGDAMANQAQTLNGAFIDAGNAVVILAKELGESGLGQAIATITRLFADATRQIAGFIDSFESIGKRSSITGVRKSLEDNVAQQKALADQMQITERNRASGVAPMLLPAVSAEDARQMSSLKDEQRQLMRRLDELQMPPDSPRLTTPSPTAAGGAIKAKGGGGGGGKSDAEKLADAYERQAAALKQQIALFGDTSEAAKVRYETEHGELEKLAPAQKKDLINRAEQLDSLKAQQEAADAAAKAAKKAQEDAQREEERHMESLTRIVEDGAGQMADAFVEFALTGKTSFSGMVQDMIKQLVKLWVQAQIIKPLTSGLTGGDGGGLLGSIGRSLGLLPGVSSGSGALAFGGPDLSGLHFSAHGDAFAGGNIIPFARGGVVTRPTLFAMASGAGLMGEAGPEAVMPLARDSSGRLGVRGGGGGVVVNVHNYAGAQVRTEQRQDADGGLSLDVIVERIESAMANRVGRGSGLAPVLERQYGLNRAAGATR